MRIPLSLSLRVHQWASNTGPVLTITDLPLLVSSVSTSLSSLPFHSLSFLHSSSPLLKLAYRPSTTWSNMLGKVLNTTYDLGKAHATFLPPIPSETVSLTTASLVRPAIRVSLSLDVCQQLETTSSPPSKMEPSSSTTWVTWRGSSPPQPSCGS